MHPRLSRRSFLRAAGVTLALPLLESTGLRAAAAAPAPRRMLAMCTSLGIHAPNLYPKETGRKYTLTPYLEALKDVRDQVTVISGLSYPEVDGGHNSEASFLTAAPHPGAANFKNTISLDQFAIERLPAATRFPGLVLSTTGLTLSYTRGGVAVPSDTRPSLLFAKLFTNGNAGQVAAQVRKLQDGQSILDTVLGPARSLQDRVSAPDRERLDQYFTAVREVEQRMTAAQEWAKKPKPKVDVPPPKDVENQADTLAKLRLMLDMVYLAFQTDSTRVVTLKISPGGMALPIEGVTFDPHNLSHHGQDPEKLRQLRIIEAKQMEIIGAFLAKLRQAKEGEETLLDRTCVLYGSNLGNASTHNTKNLPVLLAGGGFKHGQHLAFDAANNTPLCRLYVSVLQRIGIEADQFASGKGTLPGLEVA